MHDAESATSTRDSPILDYLRAIKRQAWVIALIPAIALAAALAALSFQDPVYRASMKIVVVGQSDGETQIVIGSQGLTQTMRNLMQSEVVAETVVTRLGLEMTPQAFTRKLQVAVEPSSSVLEISYDSTDKAVAVAALEQVAAVFIDLVDQRLGVRSGQVTPSVARPLIFATVFDPAHLQPNRISPRPAQTLAFAGFVGLALGLIAGLMREALDRRLRTGREAEEWFGAPLVGALPKGEWDKRTLALRSTGKGRGARRLGLALQALRANIEFSRDWRGRTVILIASVSGEAGAAAVAANLAASSAQSGRDVIVVEAELSEPDLARRLGAATGGARGLVEVLEGEANLESVLQPIRLRTVAAEPKALASSGARRSAGAAGLPPIESSRGSLRVLPRGRAPRNAFATLSADRADELVTRLRAMAGLVIIETSSLFSGEVFPLVSEVDGVVVVARARRTTRQQAKSARTLLERLDARRIGVLLTDADSRDSGA